MSFEIVIGLIALAFLAAPLLWITFGDRLHPEEPVNQIEWDAERLGWLFDELEENDLDPESPLPWRYTFFHRTYEPLAAFGADLRRDGYEIILVEEIQEPENDIKDYKLVAGKTEIHSPETLGLRNRELRERVNRASIDIYNGGWVIPESEEDVELGGT